MEISLRYKSVQATVLDALLLCTVLCLFSNTATAAMLVVNPVNPNATDSGEASKAQPLITIAAAMHRLRPGDHLVIAAGVYREPILFPSRSWAGEPQTVIEGDPKGRTLIKGSIIVTAWKHMSSGRFVADVDYEPEQIYIDGKPLRQIGGTVFGGYPDLPTHPLASLFAGAGGIWPGRVNGDREGMPVNSFHYDKKLGNVMIRTAGDSLDGHTIEVSALQRVALGSDIENVLLKNLNFEHSNTTATTRGGAVQLDGKNIHIENVHIRLADGACLGLNGTNHEIISSSFIECGQMGLGGRGSGWKIADVTVSRNNTRGFNKWWEAGGAKFVGDGGLKNSTIIRLKATDNMGDGLWFDWKNHGNRVTNSLLAFNSGFGMHLEICEEFLVDNNVVIGNHQRGIYLRQTSSTTVAFNLVANNGLDGIAVIDEGQRDPSGKTDFSVRNNWIMGNVIAWNLIGLTMPAPLGDNRSNGNVFVGDAGATSLRIGWTRNVTRAEWTASGLDTNSKWIDLSKVQRPGADAALPLDGQITWYRALRTHLDDLPDPLLAALYTRAPELEMNPKERPGPSLATWLHL